MTKPPVQGSNNTHCVWSEINLMKSLNLPSILITSGRVFFSLGTRVMAFEATASDKNAEGIRWIWIWRMNFFNTQISLFWHKKKNWGAMLGGCKGASSPSGNSSSLLPKYIQRIKWFMHSYPMSIATHTNTQTLRVTYDVTRSLWLMEQTLCVCASRFKWHHKSESKGELTKVIFKETHQSGRRLNLNYYNYRSYHFSYPETVVDYF